MSDLTLSVSSRDKPLGLLLPAIECMQGVGFRKLRARSRRSPDEVTQGLVAWINWAGSAFLESRDGPIAFADEIVGGPQSRQRKRDPDNGEGDPGCELDCSIEKFVETSNDAQHDAKEDDVSAVKQTYRERRKNRAKLLLALHEQHDKARSSRTSKGDSSLHDRPDLSRS